MFMVRHKVDFYPSLGNRHKCSRHKKGVVINDDTFYLIPVLQQQVTYSNAQHENAGGFR